MPQQPPQNSGLTMPQAADLVYVAACIQMACFWPLLRKGMGVRALCWFGPLALLWMVGYAQATHCGPLMLYVMVWLAACFVQTIILRNRFEHSRYQGFPILGFGNEHRGLFLEGLLLLGTGGYLTTIDPVIGNFVVGGGIAAFVKSCFDKARASGIALDLHDNQLDAEWRAGRFR